MADNFTGNAMLFPNFLKSLIALITQVQWVTAPENEIQNDFIYTG
jgi:hypothetical protein